MKTTKFIKAVMSLFKRKPKPEDVIDPELLKFLKKKGAYEEFMMNYNGGDGIDWRKELDINYVIKIDDAFFWDNTPQGWDYWNNLDNEYKEQ